MNKTEQTVLEAVKKSLDSVRISHKDDNWEQFATRMRTTIHTNLLILDSLLKLDAEEENDNKGLTL